MSTTSITTAINKEDLLCQGDIFKDVSYQYIEQKIDDYIHITEYKFPLSIIISQACDTISASEIWMNRTGKATKFMPSILLCPIYDEDDFINVNFLDNFIEEEKISIIKDKFYTSDHRKISSNDYHYRYHKLTVEDGKHNTILAGKIIDFKQYFTLPVNILFQERIEKRFARLDGIYAEQITHKFASYLSRVAMPDILDECVTQYQKP